MSRLCPRAAAGRYRGKSKDWSQSNEYSSWKIHSFSRLNNGEMLVISHFAHLEDFYCRSYWKIIIINTDIYKLLTINQFLFKMLYLYQFILSSQQSMWGVTVTTSVLHVRKLRYGELSSLAKISFADGESWAQQQGKGFTTFPRCNLEKGFLNLFYQSALLQSTDLRAFSSSISIE